MVSQQLKSLIVDDEPIARQMLGFALGKEGFHCVHASDGAEAIECLEREAFDVVVTDLRMPNKHGHALAVELLTWKDAPVIIVHSSIDDPGMTKDLITRGVDDIIYKPANYAAFAAKTKAMVQRRKKRLNEAGGETAPSASTESETRSSITMPQAPVTSPDRKSVEAVEAMTPLGEAEYESGLAGVRQIFPLSATAYDVFVLAGRDDTSKGKLVGSMLRDASLTADVLRLANGSAYSRTKQPTIDVEEAVLRIGFKKVGEIALALNAVGAFRSCVLPWLDADLEQTRSLAASVALERLCEGNNHRVLTDGMALCALLHPLGRLVRGMAFQSVYETLIRCCAESGVSLTDAEASVFPESHTAALGRLLEQWKIPGHVWAPLGYVGDSFHSVARLEEPLRSRVELVKLGIFAGNIAVGRWMPWDEIAPPPAQILARHKLANLLPIIEQTQDDLRFFNDTPPVSQSKYADSQLTRDQTAARVQYSNLAGASSDWMPALLASLGVATVPHAVRRDASERHVVINCLDARPATLASAGRQEWIQSAKPLFLVAREGSRPLGDHGVVLPLPASAAGLQEQCRQFSMPLENYTASTAQLAAV